MEGRSSLGSGELHTLTFKRAAGSLGSIGTLLLPADIWASGVGGGELEMRTVSESKACDLAGGSLTKDGQMEHAELAGEAATRTSPCDGGATSRAQSQR